MNSTRKIMERIILVAALATLTACTSLGPAPAPTTDPKAVYTMAAATVQSQLTEAAAKAPTATVKPTDAATATPAATKTSAMPVYTLAPQGGQPTGQPAGQLPTLGPLVLPSATVGTHFGDHAVFQYQVPSDGKVFSPGCKFSIAWGVKNDGSNNWTTDYHFDFKGGQQLSGVSTVPLDRMVKPGEKYELFIAATTPGAPGKYITRWKLVTAGGVEIYEVYINYTVANEGSC
jgi:hypothetical protein